MVSKVVIVAVTAVVYAVTVTVAVVLTGIVISEFARIAPQRVPAQLELSAMTAMGLAVVTAHVVAPLWVWRRDTLSTSPASAAVTLALPPMLVLLVAAVSIAV